MRYLQRLALALVTATVALSSIAGIAHADSFNSSRIMDDSVFDNTNSMNASQIDSWLNSMFGSTSCISTDHGFSAPDPTGYSPSGGFTFGANVSAGQVIYDASQAYSINPQVLLATLQKEQSLVSGSAGCSTLAYAAAAGYGCPDSGGQYSYSGVDLYAINGGTVTSVSGTCVNSSLKVGFSQQVIRAAWLLKFGEQRSEGNVNWAVIKGSWDNSDDPQTCYGGPMTQGTFQICPGGPATYYDGYTTIDGQSTHMDTGPTAALYWYTPHFSGNQNFWTIFTNWFGGTVSNSYSNTLNFVRLNYYTGNMQVIGYPSINSYAFSNRNTTVPYPTGTSIIPLFRPNGDLSFINLNDASGKVRVTTFSAASNFQQLSSDIDVPYPAVPNDGAVVPLFRPNGDLSFVRLNYYTGNTQVVTYSYGSYFQQLSSIITTAYPDVPTNGSVVPLFRPNGDLSFVNMNYFTGHAQVVTYGLNGYFQQLSSNIITPYPAVAPGSPVMPMFMPDEDLSFVNSDYYAGNAQIVTYSYPYYYQFISTQYLTGYPSVSDYTNVKSLVSQ